MSYSRDLRTVHQPLTANSLPSPLVAAASSYWSSGQEAFRAFDGDANTHWSSSTVGSWLSIDLGATLPVDGYTIAVRNDSYVANSPKSWVVEGSDNGTTWVEVARVTAAPDWTNGESRTYPVRGAYRHWRLSISATQGNWTAALAAWDLHGAWYSSRPLPARGRDRCWLPAVRTDWYE